MQGVYKICYFPSKVLLDVKMRRLHWQCKNNHGVLRLQLNVRENEGNEWQASGTRVAFEVKISVLIKHNAIEQAEAQQ